MNLNLPNKITLFRVFLIPIFLLVLLGGFFDLQTSRLIGVIIFIIASLTDFLDGFIARKYGLVSNFGKFMDPLADKLLVSSALIAMVELGDIWSVFVIIIISRDFIISGMRLVAANQNIVIAASIWGKVKTATQMLMIIVVLLNVENVIFQSIGDLLIYISVILTVVSAMEYIYKNKSVFLETDDSTLRKGK